MKNMADKCMPQRRVHHPIWGAGTIIMQRYDDVLVSYPTRGAAVWQALEWLVLENELDDA